MKILVVDDNEEERKVYAAYLRFVGGEVLEACDGREGIRMVQEHSPDLVLLDIRMPGMDGWETVERLKEDSRTAAVPVLAVTAHHLEPERVAKAGFCGCLEKPLSPYRIVQEVERQLGPVHERRVVQRDASPWLARLPFHSGQ